MEDVPDVTEVLSEEDAVMTVPPPSHKQHKIHKYI